MYAHHIFAEHRCAILGRMLDMPELIEPLETFEYPPLDARSEPFDLLVISISLSIDHQVQAAEWAVGADRAERVNVWNLDCTGRYGIPLTAMLDSTAPNAEFEADGERLLIYGDIDQDFAQRFAAALDANPSIREAALGSGGGSVRDALEAGLLIRRRGPSITLHGNCYSACPLDFAGGVERRFQASRNRLGFHQVHRGEGEAMAFDDPVSQLILEYLTAMDTDADVVLDWMWSAAPHEMHEPDPRDLCGTSLVTWVQRIC